jgi:ABC-2 type transport system permease protein
MRTRSPFRGLLAILYKEFIIMFRDRTTLFFMFFPPLIQIIAFGYALNFDVRNMPLVVFDQDRSRESRELIQQFQNTQTYKVSKEVLSVTDMETELRRGHAYAGLQIPPDYARLIRAGKPANVQVLIDGSSSGTAMQALNTAIAVAFKKSAESLMVQASMRELPFEVRPRVLYNPDMLSPNFYVPGVIGIALQIATVFATAMSIVRERERGTIEQLLVSPMSRWGLMLGKLLPYLGVLMTMACTFMLVMRWVFLIPVAGSVFWLLIGAFLYVFALLSMGLLISTRAQNQMQALQMTMTTMLPSVFFSGFIFPRETMPLFFQAISALLPATYFVDLMRGVVLRGAAFEDIWHDFAALAVLGIFMFALCAARFKKRVS